jgi:2-haloacid dehalogenase
MRTYVFDLFGTILDVNIAARALEATIGDRAATVAATWRTKQLEYSWVRSLMGAYRDFWALTEDALDFALAREQDMGPDVKSALLAGYRELECFSDVKPTLDRLRLAGVSANVFSNGSRSMIEAALRHSKIEDYFDEVISVDSSQTFKTDPRAYDLVRGRLGRRSESIVFISANRWDVAGSVQFGFETWWINRHGTPDEYRDLAPSRVLTSLEEL